MASREKIPTGATGRAHEYDRDSGQVFREWSVAQKAPSHTDDWDRMLRFPPSAGYVPSIKGPRSLVEMVTTVVAENLASVEDVAWLQDLPDQVVWLVWHYFDHQLRHVTCCLLLRPINFHNWKLLRKRLSGSDPPNNGSTPFKVQYFKQKLDCPGPSLEVYINPMTSASFDFIAHLTISRGATFQVTELLRLSSMQNLGVLEIIQPSDAEEAADFPRVSDRVVRAWSETPDPFPSLRVLRIWGNDFTTSKSLEYVTNFPALAVYDVAGRDEDWDLDSINHTEWSYDEDVWRRRPLCLNLAACLKTPDHPFYKGFELAIGAADQNITYVSKDEIPQTVGRFKPVASSPNMDSSSSPIGRKDSGNPAPLNHDPFPWKPWKPRIKVVDKPPVFILTDFDVWGMILYSQIGKLWRDQDLQAKGVTIDRVPIIGDQFVAPSLPYASLRLGDSDGRRSYDPMAGMHYFKTHLTFTRELPPAAAHEKTSQKRAASPPAASTGTQPKKMRNVEDFFAQFSA